jgi:polysaccharide deacetylase 2 family uncharacterized protein YibQ
LRKSVFSNRKTHLCRNLYPLFGFLLAIGAIWSWGCRNEPRKFLSPSRVHEITHEMMRASASIGSHLGAIESRLQFDGVHADRVDHLFVTLPAGSSAQSQRESVASLIQVLDRIATFNSLTRDPNTSSGALIRVDYRRKGMATHSIHIVTPLLPRSPVSSPSQPRQHSTIPRLAIILDDLGNDRAAADAIFSLSFPLTLSVLPNHAHSLDIAEDGYRRGYQIMLHLPMQSVGKEQPEIQELRPGMPPDDIPVIFDQMMQTVPNAVGVNNHQGSQATADPALMAELMSVLRIWNIFYIDSRTTAATVAYDTAQHLGVRSAFRNVPFLDDIAEISAIRKQLALAIRSAREKGEAIAIGHPRPVTLLALREILPQAEAQGVRLVWASDLVH